MLTNNELHALTSALFRQSPPENRSMKLVRLSQGFSGMFVGIVVYEGIDPFVIKAGPVDEIKREVNNRARLGVDWTIRLPREILATDSGAISVTSPVTGRPEEWSAIAAPFYGPKRYSDIANYTDYSIPFYEFAQDESDETTRLGKLEEELQVSLENLCEALGHGCWRDGLGDLCSPLSAQSDFLPAVPWIERGIESVLQTAAALETSFEADLSDYREWWENVTLDNTRPAPDPQQHVIHGDLRFANVLLDRKSRKVELVDFGNVRLGHPFEDLTKFEADLLLRVTWQLGHVPSARPDKRKIIEQRRLVALAAACGTKFVPALPSPRLPSQQNNLLKALIVLRRVFGKCWDIQCGTERHVAYLWYLAREFLRRLVWFEPPFVEKAGRLALINALVFLRRSLTKIDDRIVRKPDEVYTPLPSFRLYVNAARGGIVSVAPWDASSVRHFISDALPEALWSARGRAIKCQMAAHALFGVFDLVESPTTTFHKFIKDIKALRLKGEIFKLLVEMGLVTAGNGFSISFELLMLDPLCPQAQTVRESQQMGRDPDEIRGKLRPDAYDSLYRIWFLKQQHPDKFRFSIRLLHGIMTHAYYRVGDRALVGLHNYEGLLEKCPALELRKLGATPDSLPFDPFQHFERNFADSFAGAGNNRTVDIDFEDELFATLPKDRFVQNFDSKVRSYIRKVVKEGANSKYPQPPADGVEESSE